MKYLIKNKKECIATIVAAIVAIINIAKGFGMDINIGTEEVTAIVTAVVMFLCWYWNMPTSAENCEHTGAMRLEKMNRKKGTDGENFFDEAEPVEDEEA